MKLLMQLELKHKAKKLNFICSINPTKLTKISGSLTDLNEANVLQVKKVSFLAEFVIIPRNDD